MAQEHSRRRHAAASTDAAHASLAAPSHYHESQQTWLLRELLAAQDRQNELLEEVVNQLGASHKQRSNELSQWKEANPGLVRNCRVAAETLGKIQTSFIASMTEEITENSEALCESEFLVNELLDRYGPRLTHLNGLLQVLAQLGAATTPANASNSP